MSIVQIARLQDLGVGPPLSQQQRQPKHQHQLQHEQPQHPQQQHVQHQPQQRQQLQRGKLPIGGGRMASPCEPFRANPYGIFLPNLSGMGGGMGSGEGLSEYLDAATGMAARWVAPSTNPKRLRVACAADTVVASAVVASSSAVASEIGVAMVPSSVSSAAHADMQGELARSQRQLQETEAKLQEVERSAAEAAKEQARVLAEREEAWSEKLREAQHEARAVSERHQTELDKQAAALRALEQQLAAEKERAVADKAALALSREQAVVERESREQLEATLRAKSQALEEATNTIAELRHQLAAATETNAELRHQLAAATETNAELRHQLAAATDTNAELAADGEAVGGQRMDEVASARVAMKYGGVVDITVRSQPCGGTLVMRHFEMSNSTKQLYEVIATRLGATRDDKISVLHLGRLIPNDGTLLCETSIGTSGPENKHGVHVAVTITRKAVVASITNKSLADKAASDSRTPAATERYLKPLEITVRMMTGVSYKVEDIGLRHTTGQLYARVAQVTGISLDVLCVSTGERTPLPNDDTLIGDTTLRGTQSPFVYATMPPWHVVAFKKPGAVASPTPVPAASKRYVTRLEIRVQTLGCDDRNVGDIGLDHTTGQFYGRVADVTGIPLDDLRVTHAGVQLPNDNTMIGDTTLRTTQFPTVIAKHVKGQFPYVYAT